ncbi:hypothetical protein FE257_005016 [Aspergillus nanangensis]|uniref:Uncharacterized protein n=1 Tax=Aspergillus nanangensis TaxID=2582783 RepID=A0AAD4CR63_ASPNN|nr:hypothetical protein FE257_005016 [Aspergillus nanangensis]
MQSISSEPKCSNLARSRSIPTPPASIALSSSESEAIRSGGLSKNRSHNSRRISKQRSGTFSPTPTEYLIDTLQNTVHSRAERTNWTFALEDYGPGLVAPLTREQRIKFKIHHRMSLQQIVADYIYRVESLLDRKSQEGTRPVKTKLDIELALRKIFLTKDHRKYLNARNYGVEDVVAWAWILKSKTPYRAVLRLLALEEDQGTKKRGKGIDCPTIPPFIPLLLLRQTLDAKTFRLLLIYCLHLISGRRPPALDKSIDVASDDTVFDQARTSEDIKSLLDPNTCATFVIRLLYHARQLWPEAQLPIARAFAFYISTQGNDAAPAMTLKNVQVIGRTSNTILRLLSLPPKSNPFTSVSTQQEAQFELLKAMAKNIPVLPVTRQGYQGIIAVQLAHKKTFAERQFAELKAPSWPPWKEDKLGIDSTRGIDGMKSRAMRVMLQMKEAGYAHSRWEEVSSILAGWDTDKSPTIQTRTLSPHPRLLHGRIGKETHPAVWEARIRATRTVREAWACFLSYHDRGLAPHGRIYAAMAEKLIYRNKAIKSNSYEASHALPGDGLEVFPEPLSARDLIYVSSEPPTLDELLQHMLSQGIKPSGRFLALLLRCAPTLSAGLDFLSCSDLSNGQVKALCTIWTEKASYTSQSREELDKVPDYLFSSFIYFLCKFSTPGQSFGQQDSGMSDAFPIAMSSYSIIHSETTLFTYAGGLTSDQDHHYPKTLLHAISLLRARTSQVPQPWVHVLFALGKDRSTPGTRKLNRNTLTVLAWHEILEVTGWMQARGIDLGLQGFQALCKGFSKAVTVGVKASDASEDGLELTRQAILRRDLCHVELSGLRVENMVLGGLNILKRQFDQLVFVDPKTASLFEAAVTSVQQDTDFQMSLPPLFRVPSPAILHAFVRSLGLAEDYDGLISLLRWMSQYAVTINEAASERSNGDRIMRRTVVAIRFFLEGCWGKQPIRWMTPEVPKPNEDVEDVDGGESEDSHRLRFSDANLQEAYDIVTTTSVWGPWPSDEEVEEYFAIHWW